MNDLVAGELVLGKSETSTNPFCLIQVNWFVQSEMILTKILYAYYRKKIHWKCLPMNENTSKTD